VDLGSAARQWQTPGFVILPGFVPAAEPEPALAELPAMYPTAEGFHDGTDERQDRGFTVEDDGAAREAELVPARRRRRRLGRLGRDRSKPGPLRF